MLSLGPWESVCVYVCVCVNTRECIPGSNSAYTHTRYTHTRSLTLVLREHPLDECILLRPGELGVSSEQALQVLRLDIPVAIEIEHFKAQSHDHFGFTLVRHAKTHLGMQCMSMYAYVCMCVCGHVCVWACVCVGMCVHIHI
jgi:hypothetical protein